MKFKIFLLIFLLLMVPQAGEPSSSFRKGHGDKIQFAVLFTGDLHSHFLPSQQTPQLGDFARLKSLIDRQKQEYGERGIPTLLLDAGDCLEGSIFYNIGGGDESIRMMNHFGYDAVALGNHDWFGDLNALLERVPTNYSLLSANVTFSEEYAALLNRIKPYEIFYLDGEHFKRVGEEGFQPEAQTDYFKVAVIGFSTTEPFYTYLFKGAEFSDPAQRLGRRWLRTLHQEGVDAIVALTHLLDTDDLTLARTTLTNRATSTVERAVDVVIGGHSHSKFIPHEGKGMEIQHPNAKTTWIVKSGEFGQFLGKLDLVYEPVVGESGLFKFDPVDSKYDLLSVEEGLERDPQTAALIAAAQERLSHRYPNIFDDSIAENTIQLHKSGVTESYLGNLVIQAMKRATEALQARVLLQTEGTLVRGIFGGFRGGLVLLPLLKRKEDILEILRENGVIPSDATEEEANQWLEAFLRPVDFYVNNAEFLQSGFGPGVIHSSHVYESLSVIYDPARDRSWNISTVELKGRYLKKALNLIVRLGRTMDIEGGEISFVAPAYQTGETARNAWERRNWLPRPIPDDPDFLILSMRKDGEEIDDEAFYKIALPEELVKALEMLEGFIGENVADSLKNVIDTRQQFWVSLRDYLAEMSPIDGNEGAQLKGNFRSVQPDLALLDETFRIVRSEDGTAELSIQIKNVGYGGIAEEDKERTATEPAQLHFYSDITPSDLTDDLDPVRGEVFDIPAEYRYARPLLSDQPQNIRLIGKVELPRLKQDEIATARLTWDVRSLPPTRRYPYKVYAYIPRVQGGYWTARPSEETGGEKQQVTITEENIFNNETWTTFNQWAH